MNVGHLANANLCAPMYPPGGPLEERLKLIGLRYDEVEWKLPEEWTKQFEAHYCILPIGRVVWHTKRDVPVPLDEFADGALEMHKMHQFCISMHDMVKGAVNAADAAGLLKRGTKEKPEVQRMILHAPPPGSEAEAMLLRSMPGVKVDLPQPDRAVMVDEEGNILADTGDGEDESGEAASDETLN